MSTPDSAKTEPGMSDQCLATLYDKLSLDNWREHHPFSPEFDGATERILACTDDAERKQVIGAWLERFQPCLFGRVAAKKDLISYCFLNADDLAKTDEFIVAKIQQARSEWTRLAYEGRKSAFVLMALSPRLAFANPDHDLRAFAARLGWLYLREEVRPNSIHMDEIFLEMPGSKRVTWRWNVGVNYFGAAGDGRWWQDHRIPGGVGYSANSVGHLVKSGLIAGKMEELAQLLEAPSDGLTATKIDSLGTALEWAMRTIWNAAKTDSGPATELLPLPDDRSKLAVSSCPVKLPSMLADRNYCEYQGYYHTDETLPAEYFFPESDRPEEQKPRRLDFTYLFLDAVGNPDYLTTGLGRVVREAGRAEKKSPKELTVNGSTGMIDSFPRLLDALATSK